MKQLIHCIKSSNFSSIAGEDRRKNENAVSLLRDVADVERDLSLRKLLWESTEQWAQSVKVWKERPFSLLDVDEIQKTVTKLMQTVFLLEKGIALFKYSSFMSLKSW